MRSWIRTGLVTCAAVAATAGGTLAGDDVARQREKLDRIARETLESLKKESPGAREQLGKAYGYAVFSNLKVAVLISGGGGSGVAVRADSGERTYMKMGTAGVGIGLGGRRYRLVLAFEDRKTFEDFVEKGWKADTSASASAGTDGAEVASSFHKGIAVWQLTERGLMAQAEVAGTKFWKSEKLN